MWSNRSTRFKTAFAAGSAAAALVLAGCGDSGNDGHDMTRMSDSAASTSAPTDAEATAYNDADLTFLRMMYPHHAQAVEMAAMVDGHTTNQRLIELANDIEAAQGPEMEKMSALLTRFGQPAPTTMDHSTSGMSGMMTAEQMTELANMNGAEFDTMWLTMMIDHHKGAIEMARTELANGKNADVEKLADEIIDAQESEITTMQDMLQG